MSKDFPVLQIENVSVSYPGHSVLQDVSFDVGRGEIFGLIGLNGQGKTTLMKAILNLRTQQQGSITIFDLDAAQKNSRQSVAYLPERFEPPWFLNGLEFIRFSLRLYGREFLESQVYEAADKLALDRGALKKRVQTYSKGMRQKLGLMATFLTQCDLLILDEPMSGLDPRARSLVKAMMRDYVEGADQSKTLFFSSHVLSDMDEMCARICVVHDKGVQYLGAPSDLKKKEGGKNLEQSFLQLIEKNVAA